MNSERWKVVPYDKEQIEIVADKELHITFFDNSIMGRKLAKETVDLHNAALEANKAKS